MTRKKGLTAFRWSWMVFVVLATSAPYLLNWFSTPAGFHYTWILPPYPEDSFGYMSWARQAAHGAWLFKIKYTAIPHSAFLFHPFFLICGWLSALFSCDIGVVFWFAKLIGVGLFLFTLYRYLDFLDLDPAQSIAASIVVGISSGFGWIVAFFNPANQPSWLPADLWMPEISTYWSLLWNALFPFSLTLMLLSIFWLDRGTREGRAADFWRSGFAAGVMALLHPYSLPLVFVFAVIVAIIRNRGTAIGYLVRYFAASLPFAIYIALISRINPVVIQHSALGQMKSPSPAAYVLGFGLPLLLCVAGAFVARGQWLRRYWQIFLWFFLCLTFAYLPLWFQRKFIFGAHIPLSITAGIVFGAILVNVKMPARRWSYIIASIILVPLLAATPLYLFASQNAEAKENIDGAYFVSDGLMEGLKVLRERSKPDEVVFATLATSRLIPAFSGNTTVWGHWAMSIDYEERQTWLANLFGGDSNWDDEKRSREFWGTDIELIFADGELKESLEKNPSAWRAILKKAGKVFENGSVVIYRRQSSPRP